MSQNDLITPSRSGSRAAACQSLAAAAGRRRAVSFRQQYGRWPRRRCDLPRHEPDVAVRDARLRHRRLHGEQG